MACGYRRAPYVAMCLKILAAFAVLLNLASALPSLQPSHLFQRRSTTAEASCAHGICTLPQGQCVYSCTPDAFSYGDQNQYQCIPDINTRSSSTAPDLLTELSDSTTAKDDPPIFQCKRGACVFPTNTCATSCSRTKVTYDVCPSSGSPRQSRPSMPLLSLLVVLTSFFLCFPLVKAAPSDRNLSSKALRKRGAPTYDRMTCQGWKKGECTVIEGDCIYVQTSTKTWTHGPAQDHPCFGDPQPDSRTAINNGSAEGDALGVTGRSDIAWIPDVQCPALKPQEEILPQGICIEGVSRTGVNYNTCGSPDPCSYSAGSFIARAPRYKAVMAVMAVVLFLIHVPTGEAASVQGRLLANIPAESSAKGDALTYKGMTCHAWERGQFTVDPRQCVYRMTSTWTFTHRPIGGGTTCFSQQSSRETIHRQTEEVERHAPTERQNTNDIQQSECAARPTTTPHGEASMPPRGTCIISLDASSSVQYDNDVCNDWDPCCCAYVAEPPTMPRAPTFKLFSSPLFLHRFFPPAFPQSLLLYPISPHFPKPPLKCCSSLGLDQGSAALEPLPLRRRRVAAAKAGN